MEWDRNGSEIVGRAECLRLLAGNTVGRLAITSGALPHIVPIEYAVCGDEIIIRTSRGSRLEAAARHAVVAFETDGSDPGDNAAWSVSVTGVARPVADVATRAHFEQLRPDTGASNPDADSLLAIPTDLIFGSRHSQRNRRAHIATESAGT